MTERNRSQDGTRDTNKFIDDMPKTPGQQGRAGGGIAEDVGTEDSLTRATEQGVKGVTRVTKSKEDNNSNEDAS